MTGHASVGGSNVSNLAAGGSSGTGLVGLDGAVNTGTAGAKTGTVAIGLESNGTGTSGYGNTSITGQTVTVNGGVYNAAVANSIAAASVASTRTGTAFSASTALSISNIRSPSARRLSPERRIFTSKTSARWATG